MGSNFKDFDRGLRDFQKKIRDIGERAEALDGQHEVPFPEVFPPAFMRKHTQFATIEALFEASPWTVDGPDDFAAIPDDEWDAFIRDHTSFADWQEMQRTGGEEWAARKLGF